MKLRVAVVVALIGSLFLFGLDRAGVLAVPRQFLSGVISPIEIGWYRLNQLLSEKGATVLAIGSLREDNLKLREENDQLKVDIASLSQIKSENEALRAQLGTNLTRGFDLVPAQTLGYLPVVGTKEMILDIGSAKVSVGQVVVVGQALVGRIIFVEAGRARVRLPTDPQSQILVQTSRSAKGLLLGQFQATAKLTKVLQEEILNQTDKILTTGEGDYPPNLVVGEVTKVTKKDNELFQEAEVRPLLNFDKLTTVFVIVGTK